METNTPYLSVKSQIDRGQIALSDLERLLESLQSEGQITPAEHESLLELAWSKHTRTRQSADGV